MYTMAKKLALITAVLTGVAVAPSALAHKYESRHHHDHYVGKHYKKHHHRGGHRHKHYGHYRHQKHYGYRHVPSSYIGLGYYDGPYAYDDGLDFILRYYIYD